MRAARKWLSSLSGAYALPDVQKGARSGFRRELLRPFLARRGKAYFELAVFQLIDSERRLTLKRPFGVRGVNGLWLGAAVDDVCADDVVIADVDIVLFAVDDELCRFRDVRRQGLAFRFAGDHGPRAG